MIPSQGNTRVWLAAERRTCDAGLTLWPRKRHRCWQKIRIRATCFVFHGPAHIRALPVKDDGKTLGAGSIFAECSCGVFDGFRLDQDGRIWTSAANGVHCLSAQGELIGKVLIPEMVGNLCFGGPKLNRLFIAGTSSLYSVYLNVNGVR